MVLYYVKIPLIRQLMKRKNPPLTQIQLGEILGMQGNSVSRMFKRGCTKMDHIETLAELFGVDKKDLLAEPVQVKTHEIQANNTPEPSNDDTCKRLNETIDRLSREKYELMQKVMSLYDELRARDHEIIELQNQEVF